MPHLFPIKSGRLAYRNLGKDPTRYRLAAEAKMRSILQSKQLYRINNVVDTLNLISIQTAWSTGGFDLDKIMGAIRFGIGAQGETYRWIGKGLLNQKYILVYRR